MVDCIVSVLAVERQIVMVKYNIK